LKQFIIGDKEAKILLEVDSVAPPGTYLKLIELADPLRKLEIKLGVTVRSISEKFALTIKIKGDEYTYDEKEEIPYILGIIGATVGVGNKNEILFHSMNAEMLNTTLPFNSIEQMSDINHLIKQLLCLKNVIISRSRLETLSLLTTCDDKWKFFMPIDVEETSYSAIKNLPNLINSSSLEGIKWIVGNTDIPKMRATAFLFVVKNGKITAVCLDDFDLILLREKFQSDTKSVLDILAPKNLQYSFYPERALASENIIKAIELHSHVNLEIEYYGLKSFEESVDENLLRALELSCGFISKDELNILSSVAKYALRENDELIDTYTEIGFSFTENKFCPENFNETNRKKLTDSVHQILCSVDSLSTKIDVAKQIMNELDFQNYESKLNDIINDIKDDAQCTEEMKKGLNVPLGIDINTKCSHIKTCLEKFGNQADSNENYFHTKMLHLVLLNNRNHFPYDILKKYLDRISLTENNEPVKKKLLNDLEEKLYYQLIADLSKYSHGMKHYILRESKNSNIFLIILLTEFDVKFI
jgi:hypothetical protein